MGGHQHVLALLEVPRDGLPHGLAARDGVRKALPLGEVHGLPVAISVFPPSVSPRAGRVERVVRLECWWPRAQRAAPRLHRLGSIRILELGDRVASQRAVRTVVESRVLINRHVDQVELLEEEPRRLNRPLQHARVSHVEGVPTRLECRASGVHLSRQARGPSAPPQTHLADRGGKHTWLLPVSLR